MKALRLSCRLFICMALVLLVGAAWVASTEAAFICKSDVQGKDDEPGQKDLTRFCVGLASDAGTSCTADFGVQWNWDVTGLTGSNTGDACALFDTDGDGLANYALCVTIAKTPAVQFGTSPRLYQCNNTRADRCPVVTQDTTVSSTCSVAQTNTDPFTGNPLGTGADTTATCCIDKTDFGDPEAARLLDVCSYPSQQPNSDPSDCIVTVECSSNSECDDKDQCTNDVCSNGVCTHTIRTGQSCNDGNACTLNDTCTEQGACEGSAKNCSASDQCHDAGTCDPTSGACSDPAKANGTTCNDGNACTQTDTCQAGVCTGGDPKTCTASDQCHVAGTCNPTTGNCSNPTAPNGTACKDGNLCTVGDTCQNGVCAPGGTVGNIPGDG